MIKKQVKTSENKPARDERGRLLPGNTANPKGLSKMTDEEKLIKKTQREFVKDYKQKLEEALPKISPVLIKLALGGDMAAIKEINDIVVGRKVSKLDLSSGGKPIPLLEGQVYGEKNNSNKKASKVKQKD